MALQLQADTQRKLERLPDVLESEFPQVGADVVKAEIERIQTAMLTEARIEDFVPVLVLRYAREQLLERAGDVAVQRSSWADGPS